MGTPLPGKYACPWKICLNLTAAGDAWLCRRPGAGGMGSLGGGKGSCPTCPQLPQQPCMGRAGFQSRRGFSREAKGLAPKMRGQVLGRGLASVLLGLFPEKKCVYRTAQQQRCAVSAVLQAPWSLP